MRVYLAFGRNDLRNVRRDSLLAPVLAMPWLLVGGLRLIVPPLTAWLATTFGPTMPLEILLLSLFCVLQIPLVFGMLTGFLVLEERDDDTLTALRVTPFSLTRYAAYRIAVAGLLSAATILVCTPLSGLLPGAVLPALVPIALVGSLLAPVVALVLAAVAGNKVEGVALTKGLSLLMLGPLVAYFIAADWQLVFGLLPTYWPAKALWAAGAGESFWPYLLVGLAYHAGLLWWLLRRFQARLVGGQ